MQAEVLIAYVSRSGSTEDVAEAMGVAMEDAGVKVDVRPWRMWSRFPMTQRW